MTPEATKCVLRALAVICIAAGGFGSLLVLPYAIGTNFWWVSAAGLYFVAGAVMIAGGLVTYTMLMSQAK